MVKHLADTLTKIINKQEDTTVRITLQSDSYIEINPSNCNPKLKDNILQVTTIDHITAYFDILQVYIIEEKQSNKETTLEDIIG